MRRSKEPYRIDEYSVSPTELEVLSRPGEVACRIVWESIYVWDGFLCCLMIYVGHGRHLVGTCRFQGLGEDWVVPHGLCENF